MRHMGSEVIGSDFSTVLLNTYSPLPQDGRSISASSLRAYSVYLRAAPPTLYPSLPYSPWWASASAVRPKLSFSPHDEFDACYVNRKHASRLGRIFGYVLLSVQAVIHCQLTTTE